MERRYSLKIQMKDQNCNSLILFCQFRQNDLRNKDGIPLKYVLKLSNVWMNRQNSSMDVECASEDLFTLMCTNPLLILRLPFYDILEAVV